MIFIDKSQYLRINLVDKMKVNMNIVSVKQIREAMMNWQIYKGHNLVIIVRMSALTRNVPWKGTKINSVKTCYALSETQEMPVKWSGVLTRAACEVKQCQCWSENSPHT